MNTFPFDGDIPFDAPIAFDGAGPQALDTTLPPSMVQRLLAPEATNVILATITARQQATGVERAADPGMPATLQAALTGAVKLSVPARPSAVFHGNGQVSLTEVAFNGYFDPEGYDLDLGPLAEDYSTWTYAAGILYIHPPQNRTYFDQVYVVEFTFRFSYPVKKDFRSVFWDPRIRSVPEISLRIEARFGGVGQIGGGNIVLENADGFFDSLDALAWSGGEVNLELGIDLPGPGGAMAEADFRAIGSWRIEGHSRTETTFTLQLRERKTRLENSIPYETYTTEAFPELDRGSVGEPIPLAWGKHYGVKPMLIAPSTKTFKLASHRIRSLDGVRIKTDAGWVESGFATKNLATALFTLGADWEPGIEVAVDFSGRVNPDNTLMVNGADIMQDLLLYVGETRHHADSFNTSRRLLRVGSDNSGQEVASLAPAIRLASFRTAVDVAGLINSTVSGSLFVDYDGMWRFDVFEPARGVDLERSPGRLSRKFSEHDLIDGKRVEKSVTADQVFSRIAVSWNQREQEGYGQALTVRRRSTQYVHSVSDKAPVTRQVAVWTRSDASLYAQRALTTEGLPLVRYSLSVPRHGFFLLPTDKIRVTDAREDFDAMLEVLEVSLNLTANRVRLVCGNQRGWEDTFAFWAPDIGVATVTPAVPEDYLFWLRSEELNYVHNQRVDRWTDYSPYAHHFESNILLLQPRCQRNQINGHPAVYFDTEQQSMRLPIAIASLGIALTAGEIFVMLKTQTAGHGWGQFGAISAGNVQHPTGGGLINESFGSSTMLNGVSPSGDIDGWHLFNVSSAAGSLILRMHNVVIATRGTNSVEWVNDAGYYTFILGRSDTTFRGWIAEPMMFPRVLSATERDAVVKMYSDKFALGYTIGGSAVVIPPAPWDSGWSAAEVRNRRASHGYWAEQSTIDTGRETEMADEDDERSFYAGRWW